MTQFSPILSLKSEKDVKIINDLLITHHNLRISQMLNELRETANKGWISDPTIDDECIVSAELLLDRIADIPELELVDGTTEEEQQRIQAQNFVAICLVDEYEEHVNKLLRYGIAYNPEEE